jgi:hypothetical protein
MDLYDTHVNEISETNPDNLPTPFCEIDWNGLKSPSSGGPLIRKKFIQPHVVIPMFVGDQDRI